VLFDILKEEVLALALRRALFLANEENNGCDSARNDENGDDDDGDKETDAGALVHALEDAVARRGCGGRSGCGG